jgi:hypothetical protein
VLIESASFWLQKDGSEPRQFEDAFARANVGERPCRGVRFAVADGATEAAFSRWWARLLATAFAGGRLTGPELAELPQLERRWLAGVSRVVARRAAPGWYMEPKLAEGAFATLLGVEFAELPHSDDAGVYAAVAVGDTCLVHMRGDAPRYAFPIRESAAFDNSPKLVPSRPAAGAPAHEIARHVGVWRAGDVFYLMSDALACWFLEAVERGERPWRRLNEFTSTDGEPFREWVRVLRRRSLKNDDVTLLRVSFLPC